MVMSACRVVGSASAPHLLTSQSVPDLRPVGELRPSMNLRDQVKRGTQRSRSLLVLRDERLGPLTTSSTATSDLMAVVNAPFPSGALVPERGEELFLEAARAAPCALAAYSARREMEVEDVVEVEEDEEELMRRRVERLLRASGVDDDDGDETSKKASRLDALTKPVAAWVRTVNQARCFGEASAILDSPPVAPVFGYANLDAFPAGPWRRNRLARTSHL